MIKTRCSKCGQEYPVKEKHAGKAANCPKCGGVVVVPEYEIGQAHNTSTYNEQLRPNPQTAINIMQQQNTPHNTIEIKSTTGIVSFSLGLISFFLVLISFIFSFFISPFIPFLYFLFILVIIASIICGIFGIIITLEKKLNGLWYPIVGCILSLIAISIIIMHIYLMNSVTNRMHEEIIKKLN